MAPIPGMAKTKGNSNPAPALADEPKYRAKCKQLRTKVNDIEKDNLILQAKIMKAKKNIQRLRVERAILYDRFVTLKQLDPIPWPPPQQYAHPHAHEHHAAAASAAAHHAGPSHHIAHAPTPNPTVVPHQHQVQHVHSGLPTPQHSHYPAQLAASYYTGAPHPQAHGLPMTSPALPSAVPYTGTMSASSHHHTTQPHSPAYYAQHAPHGRERSSISIHPSQLSPTIMRAAPAGTPSHVAQSPQYRRSQQTPMNGHPGTPPVQTRGQPPSSAGPSAQPQYASQYREREQHEREMAKVHASQQQQQQRQWIGTPEVAQIAQAGPSRVQRSPAATDGSGMRSAAQTAGSPPHHGHQQGYAAGLESDGMGGEGTETRRASVASHQNGSAGSPTAAGYAQVGQQQGRMSPSVPGTHHAHGHGMQQGQGGEGMDVDSPAK